MPISINISADVKKATKQLSIFQKQQIPYATALALTRTAEAAQKETVSEMSRVFNAPTSWTLRGTYILSATKNLKQGKSKQWLTSTVGFKDFAGKGTPAAKYLLAEIFGGHRRHKRFERALIASGIMKQSEYAVPGDDMRLNAYGNLPQSQIAKMLSNLGSSPDPMQNITGSKRSRRTRRGKQYYFNPNVRAIFLREGVRAQTIFIKFVRRPTYRLRLPFHKIVRDVVQYQFTRKFRQALTSAIRTAR